MLAENDKRETEMRIQVEWGQWRRQNVDGGGRESGTRMLKD